MIKNFENFLSQNTVNSRRGSGLIKKLSHLKNFKNQLTIQNEKVSTSFIFDEISKENFKKNAEKKVKEEKERVF